jgi:hypothetical protein
MGIEEVTPTRGSFRVYSIKIHIDVIMFYEPKVSLVLHTPFLLEKDYITPQRPSSDITLFITRKKPICKGVGRPKSLCHTKFRLKGK